jgi:hypothetical protein
VLEPPCLILKVVVKPTHKTAVGHILNGRAAEVAGCEDVSSSDEDDTSHPRFSRPDHVKLLLESMYQNCGSFTVLLAVK